MGIVGVQTQDDRDYQQGSLKDRTVDNEEGKTKQRSGSSSTQFHYEEILNEEELLKINEEFGRLKNACYLDHSGATLYAKSQIDAYHSELQSNLFSNPHSRNPSSSITTDAIDYIRLRILHHFGTNADDYSVIFTSGATSAMKLLAESFRFNGGLFAYLEESHTSVVGMRELVSLQSPPTLSARIENENEFGDGAATATASGKLRENTGVITTGTTAATSSVHSPSSGPSSSPSNFDGESCSHSNSSSSLDLSSPQTPPCSSANADSTSTDPDSQSANFISPYAASKVYCLAKAALEKLMDSEEVGCRGECECESESHSQPDDGSSTTSLMSGSDSYEDASGSGTNARTSRCDSSDSLKRKALMAYPAQCNFSGFKYPLDWIPRVQTGHLDSISQMDHFYIQEQDIDINQIHPIKNVCPIKNNRCPKNAMQKDATNNFPSPGQNHSPGGSKQSENIRSALEKCSELEDSKQEAEMNQNNRTLVNNLNFRQNNAGNLTESISLQSSTTKSSPSLLKQSKKVHEHQPNSSDHYKWFVLLDAASYVATNVLDLSLHPADFIAISFYKMFGFPTGLGALLVRNESMDVLEKRYFGGGTVNIALPWKSFHVKRAKLHERFEDGTISFLSILAVGHGFDTMNKLGRSLDTISTRTFRLAQYFYKRLSEMKYMEGQPVAEIYSDTKYSTQRTQGPIVTFNLLRSDGTIIGYSEMEQMAYLHDVHLRYGCFCNPGACRRHLNLHPDDVLKHYEAGHVCGDMRDLIDGKPTGAIRVSFGYMTTQKNIDLLLHLIHTCWILPFQSHKAVPNVEKPWIQEETIITDENCNTKVSHGTDEEKKVLRIFVYPIKSCAPYEVSKTWAIGSRGLLYDREWLIVNSSGVPLTQKREPRLCQLKPKIDISNRRLVLSMEGFPDISVPLEIRQLEQNAVKADLCTSKVCGDVISGLNCGEEVNTWISLVLNKPGLKLIRMSPDDRRKPRNALDSISLANHSQFLLVSMDSLTGLALELIDKGVASSLCSSPDGNDEEIIRRSNSLAETLTNIDTKSGISGNGIDLSVYERPDDSRTSGHRDIEGNCVYDWKQSKSSASDDKFLDIASATARQNEMWKWTQRIVENLIGRFRANFVIGVLRNEAWNHSRNPEKLIAYEEETWDSVQLGNMVFKSGGPCMRCATICMDQKTSERGSEPLLTLSASRGGKANFGIHLYCVSGAKSEENRDEVTVANGRGNVNAVTEKGLSPNVSRDLRTKGERNVAGSLSSSQRKSVLENRQLASSLSSSDSLNSTFSSTTPSSNSYNTTPTPSLIPSSKNFHSDATISTSVQTIHIGDPVNVNVHGIPNPSTTDSSKPRFTSIPNPRATSIPTISPEKKRIIDSID